MEENIAYQETPYTEEEILEHLHPFVREWFVKKFQHFSPPQKYAIRNIQLGINSLISSPTGSGKTLSAFLAIINDLVTKADTGTLEDVVYCIYLSPLRALANDINKNLTEPLREIAEIAKRNQRALPIRVGTRTGDTSPSARQKMLKNPPHILITTPESLAIMLTTMKFSEMLQPTKYVIVDEIHALAENKRGVHLSLSLERLARKSSFTRIGLSATVAPLEEVARYLVGMQGPGQERPCQIIDVERLEGKSSVKDLDLQVLSPVDDLINTSHHKMQEAMFEQIHRLIQEHTSTLIFTNTRSATERVVHQLKERYPQNYANILDVDAEQDALEEAEGESHERLAQEAELGAKAEESSQEAKDLIGAHHGSLSRKHRINIENLLKQGKLKAVVCSTSLELGIDIGFIDLVILLGSPKSVARALQRIGRSGHKLHAEPKGRIVVLDRDDLVECSILLRSALRKKIDRISLPKNALDVLSQHLYGMAIEEVTRIEDAWETVRRAYPYRTLSRKDFDATMAYLAGEHASLEKRNIYAKIWIDEGVFGKRGKLARLIYMTNVGTIPDQTSVKVKIQEHVIGTITEEFLERLKPGDVFVLGGEPYEFRYSRGMTAQVRTSAGRLPTVPNWISERLPLNYDLACEIQAFRHHLAQMLEQGQSPLRIREWLASYLPNDARSVQAIAQYFSEQHCYSAIPHGRRILLEHFRDGNKKYVFVHALYGRRVNDVLSRALAYANGKITGRDVEVGITDNGFYLKSTQPIQAHRALKALKPDELDPLMRRALEKSEVLKRRFRHVAARGLMILRRYKGETKSAGRQQISSQIIMNAVRQIGSDFPLLKEAQREVLEDLMDIDSAKEVLSGIASDAIRIEERNTQIPSPFAFNMVLQGYVDILKMEDRTEFVRRLHKMVLEEIGGKRPEEKEILPQVKFSYQSLWDAQEAEARRKAEDYEGYLKGQLATAARKVGLPSDLQYHAARLLEGETTGFPPAFKQWLCDLLQGTVPKAWPDDLIKRFRERLQLL